MAKILVIEDSKDLRDMIITVLQTYGYDVAGSSEDLPVNSVMSQFNPQLVLLNVWLKNTSGEEVCKLIKTAEPGLPVILMSADEKLLVDHESCKADDILEKPFDIVELKNKIERLLNP